MPVERVRDIVSNLRYGTCSSGFCLENIETLHVGLHCKIYTNYKTLKYIFKQKNLNVRQVCWLKLLLDYNVDIQYHPRKANNVADVLSRKTYDTLAMMRNLPGELVKEFKD